MDRREVLRLLATGTALQLTPLRWRMLGREARVLLSSQAIPRTLNTHQHSTVSALAELILPRSDTPGATDVGAADFIDLILTEWYDEADRSRFLNGIADVDARTKALFGHDFIDCSPDQQGQILIALGEQLAGAWSLHDRYLAESPPDPTFYSMLRRLTLTAYYTSEAGATEELHFEIIPDRYQGCDTAPSNKEAPKQQ